MKRHIESVLEGKKLQKCDACEKRCSDKYDLTRHVKTVHEGKKGQSKECPFCHAYFQPKYLKKHISTVHEKQKKYDCDICEAKFSDSSGISYHTASIHQGKTQMFHL